MTTVQECHCKSSSPLFIHKLQGVWSRIKTIAGRIQEWERMKYHHRILLSMDDRMLNDIGLSRSDAVRISHSVTFLKFVCQSDMRKDK